MNEKDQQATENGFVVVVALLAENKLKYQIIGRKQLARIILAVGIRKNIM